MGSLDGLKVLDFSTLLPGPYATLMLADMGADVLTVERELEVLEERDVEVGRAVEGVAFGLLLVETRIREGVAVGEERTLHAGVVAVAVVVELDAVLVVHDITLAVADVERIDRTDGRRISENVARRVTRGKPSNRNPFTPRC